MIAYGFSVHQPPHHHSGFVFVWSSNFQADMHSRLRLLSIPRWEFSARCQRPLILCAVHLRGMRMQWRLLLSRLWQQMRDGKQSLFALQPGNLRMPWWKEATGEWMMWMNYNMQPLTMSWITLLHRMYIIQQRVCYSRVKLHSSHCRCRYGVWSVHIFSLLSLLEY